MPYHQVITQLRRHAEAAHLAVTPTGHSLRRSYATALRAEGASLETIQASLRHQSARHTGRYLVPADLFSPNLQL